MWLKNEVKHLDIKHLFCVSFVKHLAAEYHEQKSAGYIKTGLKSCKLMMDMTMLMYLVLAE